MTGSRGCFVIIWGSQSHTQCVTPALVRVGSSVEQMLPPLPLQFYRGDQPVSQSHPRKDEGGQMEDRRGLYKFQDTMHIIKKTAWIASFACKFNFYSILKELFQVSLTVNFAFPYWMITVNQLRKSTRSSSNFSWVWKNQEGMKGLWWNKSNIDVCMDRQGNLFSCLGHLINSN